MTPAFSILLPTRNRSHVVGYAIQSVLNQTFQDYELIVVDNENDGTGRTAQVIAQFDDPRIRSFRTGTLSMADNWEYARQQARGDYVTVLEDKQAFKPYALERIMRAVQARRQPLVITWNYDFFHDDQQPGILGQRPVTDREYDYCVEDVLQTFLTSTPTPALQPLPPNDKYWLTLPRAINSCCHRSLIQRILSSPVGRLFPPLAPDFTAAFLQLAYASHTVHLDTTLSLAGVRLSTGVSYQNKQASGKQFLADSGFTEQDVYQRLPIKTTWLMHNIIFGDYLRIRAQAGGNLEPFSLDMVNYFRLCHYDMRAAKQINVDMTCEALAWQRAFVAQPADIQEQIHAVLARYSRNRAPRSSLGHVMHLGKKAYRYVIQRTILPGGKHRTFPDILEAAMAC